MIKWQREFTETEAMAICEMLVNLASDGYVTSFYHTIGEIEGEQLHLNVVNVNDPTKSMLPIKAVAIGKAYFLIDALANAYQSTPERTNGPTKPINATDQPAQKRVTP